MSFLGAQENKPRLHFLGAQEKNKPRLQSIDVLRGSVMVLMALDMYVTSFTVARPFSPRRI